MQTASGRVYSPMLLVLLEVGIDLVCRTSKVRMEEYGSLVEKV